MKFAEFMITASMLWQLAVAKSVSQCKLLAHADKPHEGTLWPTTEIPYEISSNFSESQKGKIKAGLDWIFDSCKTCVTIRPRNDKDVNYLSITGNTKEGCWTHFGFEGGRHQLNLDRDVCLHRCIITIYTLAALGIAEPNITKQHSHGDVLQQTIKGPQGTTYPLLTNLQAEELDTADDNRDCICRRLIAILNKRYCN